MEHVDLDNVIEINGDTQEEFRASVFMAAYKTTQIVTSKILEGAAKATEGKFGTGEAAHGAMGGAVSALEIVGGLLSNRSDMKISDDLLVFAALMTIETVSFDKSFDQGLSTSTGPLTFSETMKKFKALRGYDIDHLLNQDLVKAGRDQQLVAQAKSDVARSLN